MLVKSVQRGSSRCAGRATVAESSEGKGGPGADRARQLAPLGERYLVRMREVELTTASGLVLPGAAEKAAAGLGYAEVLAVGDDVKAKDVKVGDSVMFSQYSATDFQHEGEDLAFVREGEILGVLS